MKSVIIAAAAFLPSANKVHATILGVTTGALAFPPAGTPGLSAYLTSKIAAVKALEFLAAENPRVFVASVHPGLIDTAIFRKSGAMPETLPMNSGESSHILLHDPLSCLQNDFLSVSELQHQRFAALYGDNVLSKVQC